MLISIIIIIIFVLYINKNYIKKLIYGKYSVKCDDCYVDIISGIKKCDRKLIDPDNEFCTRKNFCDFPEMPYSILHDSSTVLTECDNCNCSNVARCADNVSSVFVKNKNIFYTRSDVKPIVYNIADEYCKININLIDSLSNSNYEGNINNNTNYNSGFYIKSGNIESNGLYIPCSKGILVLENNFMKCVDDVNIDFVNGQTVYYSNNEYTIQPSSSQ